MPPSAVTAEAVAAAAVAADAAAAARDVTAAAHDELDTVAEEPDAATTTTEPATEPPVAAPASVTLDAAPRTCGAARAASDHGPDALRGPRDAAAAAASNRRRGAGDPALGLSARRPGHERSASPTRTTR